MAYQGQGSITLIDVSDGSSGVSYYTYILYSSTDAPASASDVSEDPTGKDYIGIQTTTSSSMPSWNDSGWTWIKYVGTDGTPGTPGAPGTPGVSVTGVKEVYYLTTGAAPAQSTLVNGTAITSTSTGTNTWTTVVPNYVDGGVYYTSIQTSLSSGTSPIFSTIIANQGLTDSNSNALEAVTLARAQDQHFWFNATGSGTYLAGAYITEKPIDTFKQAKDGGYLLARSDGIELGKGTNKYVDLVVTGASTDGLTFYRSDGIAAATLKSGGLVLSKGGIKAGTASTSNFVYLSSDSYGNYTINGALHNDWKEIIGTKFGVQADGTLHAAGAKISGGVSITSSFVVEDGATISDVNGLISNDAINVGGRNLFLGTSTDVSWEDIELDSLSNEAVYDYYQTCLPLSSLFEVDDLVTISFDWSTTASAGKFYIECGNTGFKDVGNNIDLTTWGEVVKASGTSGEDSTEVEISAENTSGHCAITFKIISEQMTENPPGILPLVGSGQVDTAMADGYQGYLRIRVKGDEFANQNFTIYNAKAERGNVATDWTVAPEDIETNLDTVQSGVATAVDNIHDLTAAVNTNTQNITTANELIDGNTQAIGVHTSDISALQDKDAAIDSAIADVEGEVGDVKEILDKYNKGIEIDPSIPQVVVYASNSSVKITESEISMKSEGTTSTWITNDSITTKAVVSPEIRPWQYTTNNGVPESSGSFVIVGRSNGHLSITKTG